MPVRITRNRDGTYRVTNAGQVTARRTTKRRAQRQATLLRAVEHGWHSRQHARRQRQARH